MDSVEEMAELIWHCKSQCALCLCGQEEETAVPAVFLLRRSVVVGQKLGRGWSCT